MVHLEMLQREANASLYSIEILEPTIIILQKSDLRASHIATGPIEALTDTLFYSPALNAHIIETIHPSNYGKWYNEAYPKFSKAIKHLRSLNKLPSEERSTTSLLDNLN